MTDQTDVIEELRALYSQYFAMTDLGDPRHIWTQGVYDRLVHGLINNAELLLSAASRVSSPDGQPDLTDDEKGTVFQLCHIGAGNSGDVNTTCNKAVDLIQRLLDHRCAASPSPVRSEGQAGVPADAGPCEVCGWQSRGEMIEYLDGQIQELLRENDALRTELDRCREALRCFLDDERFQVAVGGNPNVVDRMLADARAALAQKDRDNG